MTGMQTAKLKSESQGRKAKVKLPGAMHILPGQYICNLSKLERQLTFVQQLANSYHELLEYVSSTP